MGAGLVVGIIVVLLILGLAGFFLLRDAQVTVGTRDVAHLICGACGLVVALVVIGIGVIGRRNRRAKCARCGCEFPFPRFEKCPECGSERFRFLDGNKNAVGP